MEIDLGFSIAIYVVAFISVLGSVFVIISICRFGHSCTSTQLVLYLHIGQIIQDIVALPNAYTGNPIACKIVGFLHCYSGMSNIIVVCTMVITYRHMFFEDSCNTVKYFQKNCVYHAFVAPLVTALPFITDAYGPIQGTFCSLQRTENTYTSVWLYLTLVWCVVVACIGMLVLLYTTFNIYIRDVEMGVKVMKSIGMYAVFTLLFWIPRLFFEIAYNQHNKSVAAAFILVYFAGGVYTVIFMCEKEAMKLFESNYKLQNAMLNDEGSALDLVYSWEFEEEYDERQAMLSAGSPRGDTEDQKGMLTNPIVSITDDRGSDIR